MFIVVICSNLYSSGGLILIDDYCRYLLINILYNSYIGISYKNLPYSLFLC